MEEPSTASGWRWRLLGVVGRAMVSVLLPAALRRTRDDERLRVEAGVLSLQSLLSFLAEGQPEALLARAEGDPLPRGWARELQAGVALYEGRVSDAMALTEEAGVIFGLRSGGADSVTTRALRARALAAAGDHGAAQALADGLVADLSAARIIPVAGLEAHAGVAEVALMLPPDTVGRAEMLDAGVELMGRFARAHPVGRPRWLRFQSDRAERRGRASAARRLRERARDEARRLGMALELAAAERTLETR